MFVTVFVLFSFLSRENECGTDGRGHFRIGTPDTFPDDFIKHEIVGSILDFQIQFHRFFCSPSGCEVFGVQIDCGRAMGVRGQIRLFGKGVRHRPGSRIKLTHRLEPQAKLDRSEH